MNNIKELPPPKDRVKQSEVEMAVEFYEKVKSGEVTHGAVFFRDKQGNINYQIYNPDHFTYIMGMIERTKILMCMDHQERIETED